MSYHRKEEMEKKGHRIKERNNKEAQKLRDELNEECREAKIKELKAKATAGKINYKDWKNSKKRILEKYPLRNKFR